MERSHALANELSKLTTPYIADAFQDALLEAGLNERYPNLVYDIKHGSPLGNPTPLTHTTIFPNLKSVNDNPAVVDVHLEEEIALGRVSGPFTIEEANFMFGHFKNTPLGLVEKEPGSGKYRIIRHGSKKDSFGISTNDTLNSDDFPTTWHSAWNVASYVSLSFAHLLPLHFAHRHTKGLSSSTGAFALRPTRGFVP